MDECEPLAGGPVHKAPVAAHLRRHDRAEPPARRGRALQLDPIKPTLNASGAKPLRLKYDKLLSRFAFNFNLRRYTADPLSMALEFKKRGAARRLNNQWLHDRPKPKADVTVNG